MKLLSFKNFFTKAMQRKEFDQQLFLSISVGKLLPDVVPFNVQNLGKKSYVFCHSFKCDFVGINICDKSNSRRGLSLTTTVKTVRFASFHMHMILIGIEFDTNYQQITRNLDYSLLNVFFFFRAAVKSKKLLCAGDFDFFWIFRCVVETLEISKVPCVWALYCVVETLKIFKELPCVDSD